MTLARRAGLTFLLSALPVAAGGFVLAQLDAYASFYYLLAIAFGAVAVARVLAPDLGLTLPSHGRRSRPPTSSIWAPQGTKTTDLFAAHVYAKPLYPVRSWLSALLTARARRRSPASLHLRVQSARVDQGVTWTDTDPIAAMYLAACLADRESPWDGLRLVKPFLYDEGATSVRTATEAIAKLLLGFRPTDSDEVVAAQRVEQLKVLTDDERKTMVRMIRRLAEISDGRHDQALRAYADELSGLSPHRVVLRIPDDAVVESLVRVERISPPWRWSSTLVDRGLLALIGARIVVLVVLVAAAAAAAAAQSADGGVSTLLVIILPLAGLFLLLPESVLMRDMISRLVQDHVRRPAEAQAQSADNDP